MPLNFACPQYEALSNGGTHDPRNMAMKVRPCGYVIPMPTPSPTCRQAMARAANWGAGGGLGKGASGLRPLRRRGAFRCLGLRPRHWGITRQGMASMRVRHTSTATSAPGGEGLTSTWTSPGVRMAGLLGMLLHRHCTRSLKLIAAAAARAGGERWQRNQGFCGAWLLSRWPPLKRRAARSSAPRV